MRLVIYTSLFLVPILLAPDATAEDTSNSQQTYSAVKVPVAVGGPAQLFVYASTGDKNSSNQFANTFGKFVLQPGQAGGSANYWWRGSGPAAAPGSQHNDTLDYAARMSVSDTRSDTPNQVNVWVYRATDGVNQWWLAFGEDALLLPGPAKRYPVYFTFQDPLAPGAPGFQRWLTNSGTSRL